MKLEVNRVHISLVSCSTRGQSGVIYLRGSFINRTCICTEYITRGGIVRCLETLGPHDELTGVEKYAPLIFHVYFMYVRVLE